MKDNEAYMLTPKGCAVASLLDAELIDDIDDIEDERILKFWRQFQSLMLKCGYAVITDDEEE